MSRLLRKLILSGALVVAALTSAVSTASAVTWTSNGTASGAGFTATAPANRLSITGQAAAQTCTSASLTGLLLGPTGTGVVAQMTLGFPAAPACTVGTLPASVTCTANSIQLFATSYAAPTLSGFLTATTTPYCTARVLAIPGCTLTVAPTNGINTRISAVTYNNSVAVLTWAVTGQALTAAWSGCATLFTTPSGSASAAFAAATASALTYRVTSTFVPSITI